MRNDLRPIVVPLFEAICHLEVRPKTSFSPGFVSQIVPGNVKLSVILGFSAASLAVCGGKPRSASERDFRAWHIPPIPGLLEDLVASYGLDLPPAVYLDILVVIYAANPLCRIALLFNQVVV
jgi:hypothetical protein